MIKNILNNIENDKINHDDINYILNLENIEEIQYVDKIIKDNTTTSSMILESNIYYPLIYQIEDNCPTCGYRTPISRQKYSEEFIVKNVEYKLKDLDNYGISGVNCYNKDITGLRELFIILNQLETYDVNINVAVSNYDNLHHLEKYTLNSIIYIPKKFPEVNYNKNNNEFNENYEEKIIKYIKEKMHLKVTYILTLNYNEGHQDIFDIILKMKKYKVDIIELKGFDPFIDSPEEYNPQYSKRYILNIIRILKLYLPKIELKIQYATNNCNFTEDYLKLGVNTFTGIYTEYMNSKLDNINEVRKFLKK